MEAIPGKSEQMNIGTIEQYIFQNISKIPAFHKVGIHGYLIDSLGQKDKIRRQPSIEPYPTRWRQTGKSQPEDRVFETL